MDRWMDEDKDITQTRKICIPLYNKNKNEKLVELHKNCLKRI